MALVEVHPEPIDGPWIEAFVLDRDVISSRPIGYLGESHAVRHNPLGSRRAGVSAKYRNGPLNDIVDTAVAFVNERWNGVIDCVVPPPPSLHRTKQPAVLIAAGIAAALWSDPLAAAVLKATATPQMKNVPLHERAPLLSTAIQAGTDAVQGRRVLLVDDLWKDW